MLGSSNVYNASVLDDCQQTFDVVADKVTFMSNKFRKWVENSLNGVKNIKLKFKKGFKYLQEKIPILSLLVGQKRLLKMVIIFVQSYSAQVKSISRFRDIIAKINITTVNHSFLRLILRI